METAITMFAGWLVGNLLTSVVVLWFLAANRKPY